MTKIEELLRQAREKAKAKVETKAEDSREQARELLDLLEDDSTTEDW